MELDSDTMTCIITYYSVSMSFGMLGDLVPDIPETVSGIDLLDPDFEARPRHIDELLSRLGGLSDYEHLGSIPEVFVHDGGNIHIDDITLLEYLLLGRDSMTYDVIG